MSKHNPAGDTTMSNAAFLVEKTITHPDLFFILKNRVSMYDTHNNSIIELTDDTDEHFVRHAARVLHSAVSRYMSTIDGDGNRIPACNMPDSLYQARVCCEIQKDVEINAFRHFCISYKLDGGWLDCTMPLCQLT
jgi:hypothetical protein